MLAPERMLNFSELFNRLLDKLCSALNLPQNLADYTPDNNGEIHTTINIWLENLLNEKSNSTVGKAFRHLSFSEVCIPRDSDQPIITIQTRGGARSAFLHDCKDILLDFLEHLCNNKTDIQVYEIGKLCDTNIGINITGETAAKIFELAEVKHQVKFATEKALAERSGKKNVVTPVSL